MLRPRFPLPKGVLEEAFLPQGCSFETAGRALAADELMPNQPLFAVGGNVGRGRLLVLADHSVFINQMMLPRDTGNVEFAFKCAAWLRGEKGQRDQVLLLVDGLPETKLDVPLKNIQVPPKDLLGPLLAWGNATLTETEQAVAEAEKEGSFNENLWQFLKDRNLSPRALNFGGLLLLTGLLLVSGIYRLSIRARHRPEASVPAVALAVSARLPLLPLLEQRHREMLRSGNFAEPARQILRAWFDRAGGQGAGVPPRVVVKGGWWLRWRRGSQVARLWRIAHGPGQSGGVKHARLRRVLALLAELEAALSSGALVLKWGERNRTVGQAASLPGQTGSLPYEAQSGKGVG
jgi:hypothetical protein